MSKNSYYVGTSQTLGVENRSLDNILFHPQKPVLDSELNLITDINSSKIQDAVRSKVPSGWLDADYSIGLDNTTNAFGVNTVNNRVTDNRKILYVNSLKSKPSMAVVNGWFIPVGGVNSLDENQIKITLSDSPVTVGYRTDLVFLEVWKTEITANPSTINKPSSTKIFKYGNTQLGDTTNNLDEEIINPNVGFATTTRVQIQYRVRVVDDVDFYTTPQGLDDQIKVFAQGASTSTPLAPTAYNVFTSGGIGFDDYGLYVAGDGTALSAAALGTIDGYVYAIPMFKIHRRNKVAFSYSNLNGSSITLYGSTPSDRPDNLFYDEINSLDIEDLRHAVSFDGFNSKEILDQTYNDLCSGNLKTCLTENQNSGSVVSRTNINFRVDRIATTGDNIIAQPNGQRRYFSDAAKNKVVITKVITATSWNIGDTIQVYVEPPYPTGSFIVSLAPTNPIMYLDFGIIPSGVLTAITPSSPPVSYGSTLSFELDASNFPSLTNQDIFVSYIISYPQVGNAFSKPLTEVLKVVYDNVPTWGYVSVNDFDNTVPSFSKRKKINFQPNYTGGSQNGYTNSAYTYKFTDGDNRYGVGTLVSIYVKGNLTAFHTMSGNVINTKDLAYVLGVYDIDGSVQLSIDNQTRDPSTGDIAVQVNSSTTLGLSNTIRFDVVITGGNIEYDEKTKTLEDIAEVKMFSFFPPEDGSIFYLKNCLLPVGDPENIVIGTQTEIQQNGTYQTWAFVNNNTQFCTVEIENNFVKLTFPFPIGATQQVDIALLLYKAPSALESLDIYYNYKEYKGIINTVGFGATANSYIRSKTVYQNDMLDIVTSGSGAVNSAVSLPKDYEPLIPLLPLATGVVDGVFSGTLHDKRVVSGGSYTIPGAYNTPYASGKENYFTNNGGYRTRGCSLGGTSTSTAEFKAATDTMVNKLVVAKLVEMVIIDGTNHFVPGELALKVETNYMDQASTVNRITNSDSLEPNNAFDMFKVKGRPLIKIKSK